MKSLFFSVLFFVLTTSLYPDNLSLCYHQFDYSLKNVFSVVPEVFEWQMNYLREKKIDIITLEDMVRAYGSEGWIGTNVLVTIDDGWTNNKVILDFIRREKVPVTIFLIVNGISVSNEYFTSNDVNMLKTIPEISYGSHSLNHIALVKKSDAVLKKEIVDSKTALEKMLGRPVDTFAYPFGAYDSRSKDLADRTYSLSFGIENGPNTILQDRADIRRHVVYRTTTYGEFVSLVDAISGNRASKGYHVINLGSGKTSRYFSYTKVRLFEFAPKQTERTNRNQCVLIVPGTAIGPAWMYKTVDKLVQTGIRTCVMVPRNNNVPYWRPDREMNMVTNWNIDAFQNDMKMTVEFLKKEGREISVVAWNDGYDILISTLLRYPELRSNIKGIFGINPSIRENPAISDFGTRMTWIDQKLEAGDFTNESLHFYLKVKTLADLAILKPDWASPYSYSMGYGFRSNFDLLRNVIHDQSDPDLSLDGLDENDIMKEFQQVFFHPLPAFSMLLPMSLDRDLSELWSRNFEWKEKKVTGKTNLAMPVYYVYSSGHRETFARLTNTFPGLKMEGNGYFDNMSTVEMLLSAEVSELAVDRLTVWMNKAGKKK